MRLQNLRGGSPERPLRKLAEAQAEDIILNCRTPKDDSKFAKKYGLCAKYVTEVRRGVNWRWLRDRIEKAGNGVK